MNFNHGSKIMTMSFLLQFVCVVYASEEPAPSGKETGPSLNARNSFLSFVRKVTNAVFEPVMEANATVATMQQFLENPEIVSDFYTKNCVCPEDINPELFKTLVEILLRQFVAQQGAAAMFKVYHQDQNGISSAFGKTISDEALKLMREPLTSNPIDSKKLPLFSEQIPQYLQPHIENLRTDSNNKPINIVEELMVAVSKIFDQLPPTSKASLVCKPEPCYQVMRLIYNELAMIFYNLEVKNVQDLDVTSRKKNLVFYLAVLKESIRLGVWNGDSKLTLKSFEAKQADRFKIIKELYLSEKLKYLFDEERVARELLRQEMADNVINILSEYAKDGCLSKSTFRTLVAHADDCYKNLGKVFELDGDKIKSWEITDALRIDNEKQELAQRVFLQNEFRKEQFNLQVVGCEPLWKGLAQEIIKKRIDEIVQLKLQKKTDHDQALQQQHDREQQKMVNFCERVKLNALIAHAKYLKKLSRVAETNKSIILKKEQAALQLQEANNALQTKNDKQLALKYLNVLQQYAKLQKEIKNAQQLANVIPVPTRIGEDRVAQQTMPTPPRIVMTHDPYSAQVLLPIAEDLVVQQTMPTPRLRIAMARDSYSAQVLPQNFAREEKEYPITMRNYRAEEPRTPTPYQASEFVGWAENGHGEWYYWPGAGQQPRYWNPNMEQLEWENSGNDGKK